MRWIPFAMVRIAFFFTAGIVLCIYQPRMLTEKEMEVLFLGLSLSYFPIVIFLRDLKGLSVASGFIGLMSIAVAGYLNVMWKNDSLQADHLLQQKETIHAYRVKLITPAEEKSKSWRRVGSVEAIKTGLGWQHASGHVNLYWPKEELVPTLDYGDVLLIKGQPREVEAPHNPHEFDFKKHLGFKNIYHQQFVRHDEWAIIGKSTDHGLLYYTHRARNASVAVFRRFIASPQEQGILMALVLGVTDGLDNELLSAYSASGAMHVLAVSGLHVSIIYGIMLVFFRPIRKGATGEWAVAMTSLVLLWAYAFITGLSPSVLRAVTMFSFVVMAKPLGRNTNIYNTLAASAFCLLLYDPYLLMSVGFQLSYLAVLGIVYLQRPLYTLWEAPSAFLNWAWQITTVSMAAQVATLALGIFYFHQFPVYFLLSNLFVIPASCVVLVGGILLLIISPVSIPAFWFGMALEWFVRVMNKGIFLMEQLPFSVIDGLSITSFQCYLTFLLLLAGVMLIQFRRFSAFMIMFGSIVLLSFVSWGQCFENSIHIKWTVYRIPGHRAMDWEEDGRSFFVADSSLSHDAQKIRFHIQPGRIANHIRHVSESNTISQISVQGLFFYRRGGKTFLWIPSKDFHLPKRLTVNYLVVSNNAVMSLQKIEDRIKFDQLILDSSNTYRYCEYLAKEAHEKNMKCYSVLKDGAMVLSL